MAGFLVSLWESVFTPGTTPTLLVATNASFAALQFVLFALLLATYSIHFIILSFLCGGLWWSINWFAHELQASKVQEEKLVKDGDELQDDYGGLGSSRVGDNEDSSETETEEATPAPEERRIPNIESTTTSSRLRPEDSEDARKRRGTAGASESEGYISTDSEWEKVEE